MNTAHHRAPFGLSTLFAAMVFFAMWRLDFPKPMPDDLFYSGAGLHLAAGGDLSNPLLARQEFPSHYFFVYPPMYSYVLAGWLKIAGTSANSVTGLAILFYFIIASSMIAILRQFGAPTWLEWLATPGVATALAPVGLRTEPLAIALTMAGFALFVICRRRPWSIFPSFLLMFLGASTAPRTGFFAVALIAVASLEAWRDCGGQRGKILAFTSQFVVALGACGLVFLAQINFHLAEFWRTFHLHSELVGGRRLNLIFGFLLNSSEYFTFTQLPILGLLAGLLVFAWPSEKSPLVRSALAIPAVLPLAALAGALGPGTVWYVVMATLLLMAALLHIRPGAAWRLGLTAIAIFLFANTENLLRACGLASGQIRLDPGPQATAAASLRPTPEHPLLLDSSVARYLFGYRLPEGCLDIQYGARFPGHHAIGNLRPGDLFVIGPDNVEVLAAATHLDVSVEKWVPFAVQSERLTRFPRRVYIIPEESCAGLRPPPDSN
jgi:hypothetical protein